MNFGVDRQRHGAVMKPDQNSLQGKAVPDELRFIRLREVLAICGKSRTSIYDAIKNGEFPAPVKVGGRSSAWVKSEVLRWAQACIDSSRQNDTPDNAGKVAETQRANKASCS
jgi:prophage regulatory protein